jgi:hypothetical protein
MTEYTGPATAAAEPSAGPDPFGRFDLPPVPETLQDVERAIAGLQHAKMQPGHPLHHAAGQHDPRRGDVLAYETQLFEARQRLTPAETEPAMDTAGAAQHLSNIAALSDATIDGAPITHDDKLAATTAIAAAVEALGLTRLDTSHLGVAVRQATAAAARGELVPPATLTPQQQADVRDARALLDGLEAKGHRGFREALDRSGAGNDLRLIARLATLARQKGLAR